MKTNRSTIHNKNITGISNKNILSYDSKNILNSADATIDEVTKYRLNNELERPLYREDNINNFNFWKCIEFKPIFNDNTVAKIIKELLNFGLSFSGNHKYNYSIFNIYDYLFFPNTKAKNSTLQNIIDKIKNNSRFLNSVDPKSVVNKFKFQTQNYSISDENLKEFENTLNELRGNFNHLNDNDIRPFPENEEHFKNLIEYLESLIKTDCNDYGLFTWPKSICLLRNVWNRIIFMWKNSGNIARFFICLIYGIGFILVIPATILLLCLTCLKYLFFGLPKILSLGLALIGYTSLSTYWFINSIICFLKKILIFIGLKFPSIPRLPGIKFKDYIRNHYFTFLVLLVVYSLILIKIALNLYVTNKIKFDEFNFGELFTNSCSNTDNSCVEYTNVPPSIQDSSVYSSGYKNQDKTCNENSTNLESTECINKVDIWTQNTILIVKGVVILLVTYFIYWLCCYYYKYNFLNLNLSLPVNFQKYSLKVNNFHFSSTIIFLIIATIFIVLICFDTQNNIDNMTSNKLLIYDTVLEKVKNKLNDTNIETEIITNTKHFYDTYIYDDSSGSDDTSSEATLEQIFNQYLNLLVRIEQNNSYRPFSELISSDKEITINIDEEIYIKLQKMKIEIEKANKYNIHNYPFTLSETQINNILSNASDIKKLFNEENQDLTFILDDSVYKNLEAQIENYKINQLDAEKIFDHNVNDVNNQENQTLLQVVDSIYGGGNENDINEISHGKNSITQLKNTKKIHDATKTINLILFGVLLFFIVLTFYLRRFTYYDFAIKPFPNQFQTDKMKLLIMIISIIIIFTCASLLIKFFLDTTKNINRHIVSNKKLECIDTKIETEIDEKKICENWKIENAYDRLEVLDKKICCYKNLIKMFTYGDGDDSPDNPIPNYRDKLDCRNNNTEDCMDLKNPFTTELYTYTISDWKTKNHENVEADCDFNSSSSLLHEIRLIDEKYKKISENKEISSLITKDIKGKLCCGNEDKLKLLIEKGGLPKHPEWTDYLKAKNSENNLTKNIDEENNELKEEIEKLQTCIRDTVVNLNSKLIMFHLEKRNLEKIYYSNIDNLKKRYKEKSIIIASVLGATLIVTSVLLLKKT